MSEIRKKLLRQQTLHPVTLAAVERWENGALAGIERYEIAFRESSPDMRNEWLHAILFALTLASMSGAIAGLNPLMLLLYIGEWDRGLDYATPWFMGWKTMHPTMQWFMGIGIVGGIGLVIFWRWLTPPFFGPVEVIMSPARDLVSVYWRGKEVGAARLSEVRGVALEPHPGLEDARVRAEAGPKRRAWQKQINRYRLAQILYLYVGAGLAEMRIEVAAFRESAASRTPLQARAAIDLARQSAMQLQMQQTAQPAPAQPTPAPASAGTPPVRRRRRGKIT